MNPGIVLFVFIITSGVTFFYYLKMRHLERMSKIENGLEEFTDTPPNLVYRNLSIVLSLIAVGLIGGYFISKWLLIPVPIMVMASLLGCSALGFFIIYRLNK